MKYLIVFFILTSEIAFSESERCMGSVSCKHPSLCGDYDFILRDSEVFVHYDSCGRGGYGSHPVAIYKVQGAKPDLTLELQHAYTPAPDKLFLGDCLTESICEEFF